MPKILLTVTRSALVQPVYQYIIVSAPLPQGKTQPADKDKPPDIVGSIQIFLLFQYWPNFLCEFFLPLASKPDLNDTFCVNAL